MSAAMVIGSTLPGTSVMARNAEASSNQCFNHSCGVLLGGTLLILTSIPPDAISRASRPVCMRPVPLLFIQQVAAS